MKEHFCPMIGCKERVQDWATFCVRHTAELHPDLVEELQIYRSLSHSFATKERLHYRQLVSWIVGNQHLATLPSLRQPGQEG
jgi:hypothetical protein